MADKAAHETDLYQGRPLLILLSATAIGVPVFCLLLWWLMAYLAPASLSPLFEPQATPPADTPELQVHPTAEADDLRQRQLERLNSLGWVDRDAGIVHLPIERAMSLLVEQGLEETSAHQHNHETAEGSP